MDHQDWTTVTIKRTTKKNNTLHNTHNTHNTYRKSYSEHKTEVLDITYIPNKCITSESLQTLIRKRLELKLNQENADKLCAFSVNTFKNLESRRIVPTEKHQMSIQKYFGVQLKIELR
jgi:hypothetical protein